MKKENRKPVVLNISAKCSDMFWCRVEDAEGEPIGEDYDGYVPRFFPGEHFGDYVQLDIDIETGRILNWVKPTADEVLALTKKQER